MLPTGVIVGSVVISGCQHRKGGGFRYKLEAPKRLRKHLVPNAQPMPKFFLAEDVALRSASLLPPKLQKSPFRQAHHLLRRQITEHVRLLMIDSAHDSFLPDHAVQLKCSLCCLCALYLIFARTPGGPFALASRRPVRFRPSGLIHFSAAC
jgi:hypothetical protein